MVYVKLENNIVVQKQPNPEVGFIEAPDSVICGMVKNGNNYVLPTVSIETLKASKNDEINAARLKANFTTFTHAGKQIACDELSRSDIDGMNGYVSLNGAMPPGWASIGGWKAVDNTHVIIPDIAAWKAFYLSMFAAGNANFAKAQSLKAALASATTAEQINAIVW